ncbi:mechanosensitive ion channel family protein [Immundisolibacter sp.]|uniref:mechanosensitive ion channel family protein n=1 Tax=Immundisolibacter sp. TaxID=1934948 RepID=UPI0026037DED|nr:mechanosensitive ion channel family protein [Immundisolibacter sp.]MDD3650030.1 mechanosensitive ion channel family protein [Immundisolibacter sp.]
MNWGEIDWTGWLHLSVLGNTLAAWGIGLGLMLLVGSLLPLLKCQLGRRLGRLAERDGAQLSRYAAEIVAGTRRSVMWLVALFVGARAVTLPPKIDAALASLTAAVLLLQAALWAQRALNVWLQQRLDRARLTDAAGATTLSLLGFVCRVALWAVALLMILDNLGFNITTLVASLGIGGVAVALAVQNILGDLFASLSIALDKPFVIGDFIVVDGIAGTVEYVGLKTTRVRSLEGQQVVFANADLLKSRIHNYKRLYERRVLFGFGVVYDTPPDTLAAIPGWVRESVEAQPGTRFDRAHFKGFGESSLDFEVVYFVLDPDYNRYMDIQQAINLALVRRFAAEGVEFAFPTRTLHVASRPPAAPVPAHG